MSIENNLASIAKSLELIAAALSNRPVAAPVSVVAAPVVAAPVVDVAPVAASPVAASPVVTDTPVFADHMALTTFVLDSYKALGPIKGAGIQQVLSGVGVKNLNEVKPEHYAAIKAGVEALKG